MTPVDRPIIVLGVFMMLAGWVHPIFYVGVFILSLNVLARWNDYKCLRGTTPTNRQIYRMKGSWCSRGVAEFLWPVRSRAVYSALGYSWYHILPDGFPHVFLKFSFWKHVIGVSR